jgi:surface protein
MFLNCSSLEELDLSNFDTNNVTNMSTMFSGATKLKTVYATEKFNIRSVTQDASMFQNAINLI